MKMKIQIYSINIALVRGLKGQVEEIFVKKRTRKRRKLEKGQKRTKGLQ